MATINGTPGDDILYNSGGPGPDVMRGGHGNDRYVVTVAGTIVIENANEGFDSVVSSVSWTLGPNIEHLSLTGSAMINGTGNEMDNILVGNSATNVLAGGAGDDTYQLGAGDTVVEQANEGIDTVYSPFSYTLGANQENLIFNSSVATHGTGNELNNKLVGNSAANVLTGGAGDDTYGVGAGDTVVEQANEGVDLVLSNVSWTLGANVEKLILTGTGAINGTGNSLNNTFVGNSAANVLTGGAGDDTYGVGAGDTVVEQANEGVDLVLSNVSWTLGANVEKLILTGTGAISGAGNSLNNTLIGNSGANVLIGGTGHDKMQGGLGNDTYIVNSGDGKDTIAENDGTAGNTDRLVFGASSEDMINPIDLVFSRKVNDLRIAVHGTADQVTIENWFGSPTTAQVEVIQAFNGDRSLNNTEVDQLIQAMATFSQQTGLTWDQGIDQKPQEVQTVLAASWQ